MTPKSLCIREAYTNKQGEEKVSWNKVGILFEANGKSYIKLYHIPNTLISVFEPRNKENGPKNEGGDVEL